MLTPQAATVAQRLDEAAKTVDDAWQIPSDEAGALHQLVVAADCRSIIEIGVSYGYSTLHLAHALLVGGGSGYIHAFDASPKKVEAATQNLKDAGLDHLVTLHLGRAQELLQDFELDEPADFLFIDAVKSECEAYLASAWRHLADRCIIVTDNTTTHADELAPFQTILRDHPEIISSAHIPIGNGYELSVRQR